MKYIRGVTALIVGPVLFMLMSTLMLVTVVVTLGHAVPFLVHSPMWMGQVMLFVVYRGILDMKIVVERDALPAPDHEGGIVAVSNHLPTAIMMLLGAHFELLVGKALVFVAKREHLWNPFIGWPLFVTGLGIFIDRAKGSRARVVIRAAVDWVTGRGLALGVLADKSRPTEEAIQADRDEFKGRVPRLDEYQYTGVPRTGFFAAYDQMSDPLLFVVLSACSVPTERLKHVFDMVGSTFLIRVKRYERHEVPSASDRRRWLEDMWLEWNKRIRELRRRGE